MSKATEEKNKELVLEAFDTLFNQHDYIAAEWVLILLPLDEQETRKRN
jgi:hypothetical protein